MINGIDAGATDMEVLSEVGVVGGPAVIEVGGPVSVGIGATGQVNGRSAIGVRAIVHAVVIAITVCIGAGCQGKDGKQHQPAQQQGCGSGKPAEVGLRNHDFPSSSK